MVSINEVIPFKIGRDAKDLEHRLMRIEEIRYHSEEKFFGSSELFMFDPLEYARTMSWI